MPTPVSAARQCLTEEAARTLDDAVAVARRRTHAQTTSLHVVSALLAPPSSTLREACSRARSCAYSPRLQFRALELSVAASLDRLPTAKTLDEPPISNSLMAAIKRAQANQRRHPETFHLYQQQYNTSVAPSISAVKIELMHFIISILDDPIVSRVLGEAGFRSTEIKLAILNPPTISRFSKSRCPPLFLCNLPDSEISKRGFNFPFAGVLANDNNYIDENSRRIGEIFIRKSMKNPLLIGVCANDALNGFIECVQKGKLGVLPDELTGISVINLEKEIFEYVNKSGGEEMMRLKFKELNDIVIGCKGVGIVISYGELIMLVEGAHMDKVKHIVSELSRLVEFHNGKIWLIGASSSDDNYGKFQAQFPTIEKNWDLHLLPITSSKPSSIGGVYPKSSLMGSFVPFGGFFSLPSELENVRKQKALSTSRCNLCNEKYEQEVSNLNKEGSNNTVSEKSMANLPSWLQRAECGTSNTISSPEVKDDKAVFNARLMGLDKKWTDICHRLHRSTPSQQLSKPQIIVPDTLPKENISSETGNMGNPFYKKLSLPIDMNMPCKAIVTTDLRLGSVYNTDKKKAYEPIHEEYTCQYSSSYVQLDSGDMKQICKALMEKVSWQNEAIYAISQTISRCKNGQGRNHGSSKGTIWLSFLGPDKVGKRKIASALAEKVYGSKESYVALDLSFKDGINRSKSIFDRFENESKFRGKMIVDYVAEELTKKSHSVILLEDVENADILLQNSLLQAIKTGRFPNSHGREISISNKIFIITSRISKINQDLENSNKETQFPEEKILSVKDLEMKIVVENVNTDSCGQKRKLSDKMSQRGKRVNLDLNLALEEIEEENDSYDSCDYSNNAWLGDLYEQMDENVVFKPFDFDGLSESILKDIKIRFEKISGYNNSCLLEIDSEVLMQIVGASWLSDSKKGMEDWVEKVLCKSFVDVLKRIENLKVRSNKSMIMNLVTCEDLLVKEHAPGIQLPARITVDYFLPQV